MKGWYTGDHFLSIYVTQRVVAMIKLGIIFDQYVGSVHDL